MTTLYRRATGALVFALAASSVALATGDSGEPAPQVLAQGTAHDALYALAFENQNGIAVGARGSIFESSDAGNTWRRLKYASGDRALFGIAMSGSNQIAVGQQGLILHRDGDGAWTDVASGTEQRLLGVGVNRHGLGAAVGGFGAVLVTTDGGKSWTPVSIDWTRFLAEPVDPHVYAAYVSDSGVITIGGEFGLILRSADAGQTWLAVHTGEASVFDFELRRDGVGYAVGQEGMVLITRDGGNNWETLPTGSKAVLLGVRSWPDGHVVVAGMRETLDSRDGGLTWTRRTAGDLAQGWYSAVASPQGDGSGAIAVGYMGKIIRFDR